MLTYGKASKASYKTNCFIDLTEFRVSAGPMMTTLGSSRSSAQNLIKLSTSSCNMYHYMTGFKSSRNSYRSKIRNPENPFVDNYDLPKCSP